MIRLDLSSCKGFAHHRSGWGFCISQLKSLHSKSGIFVDDFIERSFSWEVSSYYHGNNPYNLPYQKDWVGFIHNPPNVPNWFDVYNSPQAILSRDVFQQSLKTCKCLITLSKYLKDWLQPKVNVPVISIKHPTEIPENKWTPEKFLSQPRIPLVQVGYWLRKLDAIQKLQCGPRYHKVWLPSNYDYALTMLDTYQKTQELFRDNHFQWGGVQIHKFLDNELFDDMMCRCVVLIDLYDSSANNAVIECIARNTPILVNKISPIVEYLGEKYPLYFECLTEASELLTNTNKIFEAHSYLKKMNKTWISGKSFVASLQQKLLDIK